MGPIFVLIFFGLLAYYTWSRRHFYLLSSKVNGPFALPIIGNLSIFTGDTTNLFKKLVTLTGTYGYPIRVWFGPLLVLYFSHPKHLEKILTSSKLAYKHDLYKLVQIYIGDGLVSNFGGEKYKKHKKLIQPLVSLKYVIENQSRFQKHFNKLLRNLETYQDKGTFDVYHAIHTCFADIIGETVLGIDMGSQDGMNEEYLNATINVYKVGYHRMSRPWLIPNFIFNLTSGKKAQDYISNVTTNFIKEAIRKSRKRIESNENQNSYSTPIIDKIGQHIKSDPNFMNDEDFIYHLFTLYLASEDTIALITSVLCICFGMYPEYQKKAIEEIHMHIGEKQVELSYDDLQKLEYLDMCIRDVLRLIPIAPLIIRQPIEDFEIDNFVIPKGCATIVSLYEVHRNPEFWSNPNHFHPDHFLPEVANKRHPFAYVPFSAGGRSCIGKIMAMIGLKMVMVNILQKFEISAEGKFPDIVLKADITVRSESGYKLSLKKRV